VIYPITGVSHTIHRKRVRLGLRYREVKDQIDSIYQSTNLETISKVGMEQLKWIDEVLSRRNPSAIDVHMALEAANVWSNMVEIMYGDLKAVGISVRTLCG